MGRVLVLAEVFCCCEAEAFLLGAWPFLQFAVAKGRELEVFLPFGV
jgi:hypothetical protein